MIRVLYFASLRDQLKRDQEQLDWQPTLARVADVKNLLRQRGGEWAQQFADDAQVLAAVNQEMAQDDSAVADGDEVGFFPPVTGG